MSRPGCACFDNLLLVVAEPSTRQHSCQPCQLSGSCNRPLETLPHLAVLMELSTGTSGISAFGHNLVYCEGGGIGLSMHRSSVPRKSVGEVRHSLI